MLIFRWICVSKVSILVDFESTRDVKGGRRGVLRNCVGQAARSDEPRFVSKVLVRGDGRQRPT